MAKQQIIWVGNAIDKTPVEMAKHFNVSVTHKNQQSAIWYVVGTEEDIKAFIECADGLDLIHAVIGGDVKV